MDNVWILPRYVPQALLLDSQMGQFGLGGELAISTDKLHQRGPIGLQHLVTNKWYIYGEGQIR
jgi:gamma-glutamyl phosphate reductase